MRLHIKLSASTTTVPFSYQQRLVGVFHAWLGKNQLHNETSLYSLSWLTGGKLVKEGFAFADGAGWFISAWDPAVIKAAMSGAIKQPECFCGMEVKEVVLQEDPHFSEREQFFLGSPVLIRKYRQDNTAEHLTFDNSETTALLTQTLQKKLTLAGINASAEVAFDRSYTNPKTKLVSFNGINNRANYCPIIINGSPEAIQFAWNVGVGHSTGSGFGSLITNAV